jgi:hypothetical protein
MKTVTLSLNMADMLREHLDHCSTFKRDSKVDRKVFLDYLDGNPLSEELTEAARDFLNTRLLKLFLDAKETLIVPDDALHRLAGELHKDLGEITVTFLYEEFYAYQFVDKLNDIVRRARRVREIFAKAKAPPSVTALCREAYQAYVYGYHTASVALVRCLVESSLKDRLGVEVGELWKLNDIAMDTGLYSKRLWHKVDQIRRQANAFIHEAANGKTSSEVESLRLIGFAQEVLQAIHT